MASLTEIMQLLQSTLKPQLFNDYCPNGLQVEGRPHIKRLVTGVTACQALIDKAIELHADAILVHHGFFWKNENPCVVGMKKNRLQTLLKHDISVLAYHLPLDAHAELGNNAQLAQKLGLNMAEALYPDNPKQVGNIAVLAQAITVDALIGRCQQILGQTPLHIAGQATALRRIGFCTGAAQGFIEQAALMGCDAYISGEISEPTVHIAREMGIHYLAAGHHATERYGVQALGDFLAAKLGIEHIFVDIENPV
ncbi:Nif3-like dinuclear metal center hexameric protein [Agitococcus lubricus]|uniref:GTP cyclohydrolase 1 type 2 homolog n=1 Tax=Agitococcus lubricus TaxID=1077255 RepID=A0A2T5J0M6_9GAMM|nr:Nif3-like dinuclear metal center hexameric protein [Agitococcus lubricus]PTQ89899.1 dinuclear metal center YbgI/SA1388 family protein [Agitococcus lubricus]